MLERLKKKRMSRDLQRKSQKRLLKSRSTSPRPKQKMKESKYKQNKERSKTPVSRFDDTPKGEIIMTKEKEIASPFNETKNSELVRNEKFLISRINEHLLIKKHLKRNMKRREINLNSNTGRLMMQNL